MYYFENYLKIIFLINLFIFKYGVYYLALFICIFSIIRSEGTPKNELGYAILLVQNFYVHNILYLLSFFTIKLNFLHYLPIVIHFFIGICEFLILSEHYFYKMQKIKIDKFNDNKITYYLVRSRAEILIFFVFFF